MRMYDIIRKKRDGEELGDAEIAYFIRGYTGGEIPDYQASALLMAIFFRGLSESETLTMTAEMTASGDTCALGGISGITADKHSTGGVGDSTTLIAAPVAAACGLKIAKLSGRGLGFTGGTVDKLESIPGYRTEIPAQRFHQVADKLGICLAAQSGELAPADKKLYALRDATAAVESLPLIASSIMSKKLAGGAQCIVLDVKCGGGAFMKTPDEAAALAGIMVKIGHGAGRRCSALVTDMNEPLGRAVGNSLELIEALDILSGRIKTGRLRELSLRLAAEMLTVSGLYSADEAAARAVDALSGGAALELFAALVREMGGDPGYVYDPSRFSLSDCRAQVRAESDGYIGKLDAAAIGRASLLLGAGRDTKDSKITHGAGVLLHTGIGDYVSAGETVATLYADTPERLEAGTAELAGAVGISGEPPAAVPLVLFSV